jgi:hypothetical protein
MTHAKWRGFAMAVAGLLCLFGAAATAAEPDAGGTYMIEGGSYMITLELDGDSLVVVEPNKRSEYTRQADGSYHFYNPNTDTTYGIRVLDANTIEAFMPFVDSAPTRLVRMAGGGGGAGAEPGDSDRYGALAEQYAQMIESDPDNVQSWAACAAVAMKRSIATTAEADAYATQMAAMLQALDASASPCPEVIANW